ncbi:MAG TPA: DMT family transporter [Burkholderiaceae bacterium]
MTSSPSAAAPGSHRSSWAIHLKLVGMAALWGGSWPCGRVLAQALPPLAAATWRFAIALVLLLAWMQVDGGFGRLRKLTRRQWGGLAVGGAVGVFGYAMFFMLGLSHVAAGRAALVVTTNPVVTTLIAAWWFGERLNWRIGAGMALAAAGALIVMTHGAPWTLLAGSVGKGEALLLGCVATWVAYTLIGRRLLAGIDALTTTTVTAAFGLVMLAVTALVFEGPAAVATPLTASATTWVALGFLAAGATVVAYAWYFEGVAALGAGAAAGYISLVPLFGVLFATSWLGEPLDASIVVGGALAVIGMAVMNLARR